jgi:ABC-type sulfate transport system permease subunit
MENKSNQTEKSKFWKAAIFFGVFTFIANVIVIPLIKKQEITLQSILIGIPIWTVAGIAFAYFTTKYNNKLNK